jgi:hypothetical protein
LRDKVLGHGSRNKWQSVRTMAEMVGAHGLERAVDAHSRATAGRGGRSLRAVHAAFCAQAEDCGVHRQDVALPGKVGGRKERRRGMVMQMWWRGDEC